MGERGTNATKNDKKDLERGKKKDLFLAEKRPYNRSDSSETEEKKRVIKNKGGQKSL